MFGKEYYKNPEILLDSFGEMNHSYEIISKKDKKSGVLKMLESIYIRMFGIPEIGFQSRFLYFRKLLKKFPNSPRKILDAGSGIGSQTLWLSKQYKGAEIISCDVDSSKLEKAKKFTNNFYKSKKIKFLIRDISHPLKEKNIYDLIVNIDVLEHVKNYKAVLGNFQKLLKVGGYLYLHTPQPGQKRIFKQLKTWEHEGHTLEGYTPEELTEELKKLGFNIIEKRETFGYFGKLAWELNHLTLMRSFVLAGLFFPLFYCLAKSDLLFENKDGLGTAILAKKVKTNSFVSKSR